MKLSIDLSNVKNKRLHLIIDSKDIKVKGKDKYTFDLEEGNHNLIIREYAYCQSRFMWILQPILVLINFLMIIADLFSGDLLELDDDFLYAQMANIDFEITENSMIIINLETDEKGNRKEFNILSDKIKFKSIKQEKTATTSEKVKWLIPYLLWFVLLISLIVIIIYLCATAAIISGNTTASIFIAIVLILIALFFLLSMIYRFVLGLKKPK